MFERLDKLADLQAVTAQSAEADTNVASREERGSSSFPTSHVRKVRRTVTVRGRGVRGYFPSKKAVGRATFESLIEEDALRVLEIARCVISYETQPLVLVLNDGEGQFTYTPDVAVRTQECEVHFLEVKSDPSALSNKSISRLKRVLKAIRPTQHRLSILFENDVRRGGLQEELKSLMRLRPHSGRPPSNVDHSQWDPLQRVVADEQTATRWAAAQDACDQLLTRVLRRDPGDPLAAVGV